MGEFRLSGGCDQNIDHDHLGILSYYRFDPDDNHFSLHLCMRLSCSLHKVVDSTDLCAYLNGASFNIDTPVIMTTADYYDSQDLVSPNYGHHDCTVMYPLYNLNCKHRTRTLASFNKCYVPCCDEEKNICYDKKLKFTTEAL